MKISTEAGYWAICEVCDEPIEADPETDLTWMCSDCERAGFCEDCAKPGNHDCQGRPS